MTDRTPAGHGSVKRPARLTKGSARVWGWVAGTIAFVMPWAVIGAKARSSASTETAAAAPQPRPVVIIRRITKRIIVQQKAPTPTPQVRYVTVGGGSSGGSGGSSGGGGSAPPPPPPASTGGS